MQRFGNEGSIYYGMIYFMEIYYHLNETYHDLACHWCCYYYLVLAVLNILLPSYIW